MANVEVTGSHNHKDFGVIHGHFHKHTQATWVKAGMDCRNLRHNHHANAYDAVNGVVSVNHRKVTKAQELHEAHRAVIDELVEEHSDTQLELPVPPVINVRTAMAVVAVYFNEDTKQVTFAITGMRPNET